MSDGIRDEEKDKAAKDNCSGGAPGGCRFRKYRRIVLALIIAAAVGVPAFLVCGAVRSAGRGRGAGPAKTGGKLTALDPKIAPGLRIELAPGVTLDMMPVKAGAFTMSRADKANWKDEVEHEVTLKNDFCIGVTEVTQAQYRAVTGGDPSYFKGDDRPVEMVSWDDAMAFCERLNESGKAPKGFKFTLPTEAQWEFAARGGLKDRKCKYSGSDELKEVGWYGDSDNVGDGIRGATRPVAGRSANELGLYDMSGNVWEWCLDDYAQDSSKPLPESRLVISRVDRGKTVFCQFRTVRGGSWSKDARFCRCGARYYYGAAARHSFIGFRVALVKVPEPAAPKAK